MKLTEPSVAAIPLVDGMYCLWFPSNLEAIEALADIAEIESITEQPTFIKLMMGMERGWGFHDHEQGFIAKCAVGG